MLVRSLCMPPKGWNSYDSYLVFINEREASANLEAFEKRLKPFGYEYFTFDACWYMDGGLLECCIAEKEKRDRVMHVDEWGRFIDSKERFPHGIRAIADRCHEMGLKFGVHMMRGIPRLAVARNTPVKGHPSARAKDICDDTNPSAWCKFTSGINMNAPGAQEYYDSVAEYLTEELTVDFVKYDDLVESPLEIEGICNAFDKQKRPVVLSLSPGNYANPVNWEYYKRANMVRITGDVWDKVDDQQTKFDRWQMFENLSGPECWIDLDMIPIGPLYQAVPDDLPQEFRTQINEKRTSRLDAAARRLVMTQLALSASPLIYGGDIAGSTDEDIAMVTHPEVLACNENGICGKMISFRNYLDVRRANLKNDAHHGWIGVFNRRDIDSRAVFSANDLGFSTGGMPELFEIWSGNTHIPVDGKLDITLKGCACLFFKF